MLKTFDFVSDNAPTALVKVMMFAGCLVWSEDGAAQLIAPVVAVRDPVALVRLVYTLLEIATLELLGGASDGRAAALVSVVETIVVAIANPGLGDAVARTLAGKLQSQNRVTATSVRGDHL